MRLNSYREWGGRVPTPTHYCWKRGCIQLVISLVLIVPTYPLSVASAPYTQPPNANNPVPPPEPTTEKHQTPMRANCGETWEEEIRKSAVLKSFQRISDLVEFMVEEGERVMANSAQEGDYFFITTHYLYSLRRNYGSIWKIRVFNGKRVYDKWLKPMNNLNSGTTYHERCVENSPEFMPLDNSLIYDLKLSHKYHCAVTPHLPDNDPRKHTMVAPTRIIEGIKKSGNIQSGHRVPNE